MVAAIAPSPDPAAFPRARLRAELDQRLRELAALPEAWHDPGSGPPSAATLAEAERLGLLIIAHTEPPPFTLSMGAGAGTREVGFELDGADGREAWLLVDAGARTGRFAYVLGAAEDYAEGELALDDYPRLARWLAGHGDRP